jgi:predicted regulator of Ras-like GTPase activity (Roadblock/LC7/MglB family)
MGRLSRESSVDGDGGLRHKTLSKGHSHLKASFQNFENPADCNGFAPGPDRPGAGLVRRIPVCADQCGQAQSSDETEPQASPGRDSQRRRHSWREPSAKRQRQRGRPGGGMVRAESYHGNQQNAAAGCAGSSMVVKREQQPRKQHAVMKLFNLMKGIFSRPAQEEPVTEVPLDYEESVAQEVPYEEPSSAAVVLEHAYAPAPVAAPRVQVDDSMMVLPLASLISSLPVELQQRVRTEHVGQAGVAFPLQRIMGQLSQGQVIVTFGEIRQSASEAFTPAADRDNVAVVLPLGELVGRLRPAMLGRRAGRQIQVPDEVASPFAGGGQGLNLGNRAPARNPDTSLLSRPRVAQSASPVPPLADPRSRGNVTSIRKPAAPGGTANVPKQPMPAPARPVRPAAPAAPISGAQLPPPKAPLTRPPTSPVPASPAPKPVPAPSRSSSAPIPFHAPSAAKPVEEPAIWIEFSVLEAAMPESLKLEITQFDLSDSKVALPAELVHAGLMRGKVSFSWKQLRSWVKPTPLSAVSAHDSMIVNLPLSVIAPLFMNRNKQVVAPAPSQKQVRVDEQIPNLFFGFPQPAAAPEEVEEAEEAAPQAREIPVQPVPKQSETNYFVWDDASDTAQMQETPSAAPARSQRQAVQPGTTFASRKSTPNDVVTKASLLEGVYGAMVALPDGLLVASKLSPDVNGEAIAGLIPQMYSKLSGCTKELRMGELNNLNFTVGNVPWKIFRVNGIFFAAYGCAGEPLPGAHLAELAAELDYKKTQ